MKGWPKTIFAAVSLVVNSLVGEHGRLVKIHGILTTA